MRLRCGHCPDGERRALRVAGKDSAMLTEYDAITVDEEGKGRKGNHDGRPTVKGSVT